MSLGKVLIEDNNLKSSNFDFSHDAPTTLNFGVMHPVHLKMVQAGTKSRISTGSTTYFAPLTSPTHGKIFLHEYTQFVSVSSLFKNFPYFLAQLSRLNNASDNAPITPIKMPRINAPLLLWHLSRHGYSQYYIRAVDSSTKRSDVNKPWNEWTAISESGSTFESWTIKNYDVFQPWKLPRTITTGSSNRKFSPDSYDYRWYSQHLANTTSPDHSTLLKLNKFGSLLNDIFLCCGMRPCMDTEIYYSALPLFAMYKAYYDIMEAPISQYNNWENTYCCRLLKWYDINGTGVDYDMASEDSRIGVLHNLWCNFIDDLVNMYYTANMDYFSSHIPVDFAQGNPLLNTQVFDLNVYQGNDNYYVNFDQSGGGTLNPIAKVAGSYPSSVFSQLTDEWCKKAYYLVNKRSQLGYALKKELKVRGYRDWCFENDSKYINHSRTLVPITQLQNQSDTLAGDSGDVVGQRCGNAQVSSKTFSSVHYAQETGFIVHFVCIVPETRYTNGASEDSLTCDIMDWYSPSSDGFGYQASPRIQLGYRDDCEDSHAHTLSKAFGLAPRHFGKKVSQNLKLGGFALRSQRNTYDNYYLDRQLIEHQIVAHMKDVTATSFVDSVTEDELKQLEIPNAGKAWRQFAKFNVFNKYDRIFDYRGSNIEPSWYEDWLDTTHPPYPASNIVCLLEVSHHATARMLPTSKSWDTVECEDEHSNTFTHEK